MMPTVAAMREDWAAMSILGWYFGFRRRFRFLPNAEFHDCVGVAKYQPIMQSRDVVCVRLANAIFMIGVVANGIKFNEPIRLVLLPCALLTLDSKFFLKGIAPLCAVQHYFADMY